MKENRYTMPQQFIDDPNVALKWKLYAHLNGYWIGGKTVYARNDTLAKTFKKSERAIQSALSELEQIGLITRDIKGLSRYILPGGIKEGRSPASPPHEAQLHQGDEAQLHHTSDSISGIKSAFAVIETSYSEESTRAVKEKDPSADKATRYWHKRCKDEYGLEPSGGLIKTKAIIQRAHKTLSYPQIREMMDTWFNTTSLDIADAIQITRCLSPKEVDKFVADTL